MVKPTSEEIAQRDSIFSRVIEAIKSEVTIKLPPFDSVFSKSSESALLSIVNEPNPFCGFIGEFAYQFEGEEDLLHVFVVRTDGMEISVEDAQWVVAFALPNVPAAFFFVKPGAFSQHFYIGHDFLLEYCES